MGSSEQNQGVRYYIVDPNQSSKENKKVNEEENLIHQLIKFYIVKLNEEYKLYQKNLRYRQNVYAAEIFISLISICLGQLFGFAEHSDIMAKVGTQLSSLFGGIGLLVTIVTAYLNNTAQKYLESSSSTELDENTFKLMYLHIDDKVIKEFVNDLKKVEVSKGDKTNVIQSKGGETNVDQSESGETNVDQSESGEKKDDENNIDIDQMKLPLYTKDKESKFNMFTALDFYIIQLKRRNDILTRERIFDSSVSVLFFFFILAISIFLSLVFQDTNQTYLSKDTEQALSLSLMYLGGIWFGLIFLSKSYDLLESLENRMYVKNEIKNDQREDESDKDFISRKIRERKAIERENDPFSYWLKELVKYEKKNTLSNSTKKSKRSFRIIHLQLYPFWVTNIELILNGIKPMILIDRKKYKYGMKKYDDRIFFNEIYSSNKCHKND
ncbi:10965_t:CDS:2 [Dentiscutata heterogama]|uniref:10965_t:CDS:1 n=1 Tax=Dentiscutata heterogama TaxID=1316150 RepID=A0ACA9KY51_9GLOM|nr:10965_t:CDS:2 [Dentiscutata heterogama]